MKIDAKVLQDASVDSLLVELYHATSRLATLSTHDNLPLTEREELRERNVGAVVGIERELRRRLSEAVDEQVY